MIRIFLCIFLVCNVSYGQKMDGFVNNPYVREIFVAQNLTAYSSFMPLFFPMDSVLLFRNPDRVEVDYKKDFIINYYINKIKFKVVKNFEMGRSFYGERNALNFIDSENTYTDEYFEKLIYYKYFPFNPVNFFYSARMHSITINNQSETLWGYESSISEPARGYEFRSECGITTDTTKMSEKSSFFRFNEETTYPTYNDKLKDFRNRLTFFFRTELSRVSKSYDFGIKNYRLRYYIASTVNAIDQIDTVDNLPKSLVGDMLILHGRKMVEGKIRSDNNSMYLYDMIHFLKCNIEFKKKAYLFGQKIIMNIDDIERFEYAEVDTILHYNAGKYDPIVYKQPIVPLKKIPSEKQGCTIRFQNKKIRIDYWGNKKCFINLSQLYPIFLNI